MSAGIAASAVAQIGLAVASSRRSKPELLVLVVEALKVDRRRRGAVAAAGPAASSSQRAALPGCRRRIAANLRGAEPLPRLPADGSALDGAGRAAAPDTASAVAGPGLAPWLLGLLVAADRLRRLLQRGDRHPGGEPPAGGRSAVARLLGAARPRRRRAAVPAGRRSPGPALRCSPHSGSGAPSRSPGRRPPTTAGSPPTARSPMPPSRRSPSLAAASLRQAPVLAAVGLAAAVLWSRSTRSAASSCPAFTSGRST